MAIFVSLDAGEEKTEQNRVGEAFDKPSRSPSRERGAPT